MKPRIPGRGQLFALSLLLVSACSSGEDLSSQPDPSEVDSAESAVELVEAGASNSAGQADEAEEPAAGNEAPLDEDAGVTDRVE